MGDRIYKITEITGSSPAGIDQAIQAAVERAARTIHNIGWFQVVDTRGVVENGKVAYWQVTIKLGFTLD